MKLHAQQLITVLAAALAVMAILTGPALAGAQDDKAGAASSATVPRDWFERAADNAGGAAGVPVQATQVASPDWFERAVNRSRAATGVSLQATQVASPDWLERAALARKAG